MSNFSLHKSTSLLMIQLGAINGGKYCKPNFYFEHHEYFAETSPWQFTSTVCYKQQLTTPMCRLLILFQSHGYYSFVWNTCHHLAWHVERSLWNGLQPHVSSLTWIPYSYSIWNDLVAYYWPCVHMCSTLEYMDICFQFLRIYHVI